MTIQESTICSLIQTFPVLLILAQNHNKCLKTPLIYKPPSPTHSPEYYEAMDALFQSLYGHDHNSHHGHDLGHHGYDGHSGYDSQPCQHYTVYNKKSSKPCYQYVYPSHSYPGHGTSYPSSGGHSYSSYGGHSYPSYGGHSYQSYGTQKYPVYGVQGAYGGNGYPSFKKGNMYDVNSNVSYRYASGQVNTVNNKYKVVVKKTKIGRRKKSGKLRTGVIYGIMYTLLSNHCSK